MFGQPETDDKKSNLFNALKQQHPDMDDALLQDIANEYGDYTLNPLRPYIAGAAAGSTYSIIKLTSDENGKTSFFNRLAAGLAPLTLFDNMMGPMLANMPAAEGVYNSIIAKDANITDEQALQLTQTVFSYLYVMQHGAPAFVPTAVTMMTTELVEKQLDKQDVNKSGPDDPNGP